MMSKLEEKYAPRITDPLVLKSITHINFKPHPFTIGTRHVADASDNHCGILGEETMRKIPCAAKGCLKSYDEHTSDCVMMMLLLRNTTSKEIQAVLVPLCDDLKGDGIDGFVFVDTPEKFRIN